MSRLLCVSPPESALQIATKAVGVALAVLNPPVVDTPALRAARDMDAGYAARAALLAIERAGLEIRRRSVPAGFPALMPANDAGGPR